MWLMPMPSVLIRAFILRSNTRTGRPLASRMTPTSFQPMPSKPVPSALTNASFAAQHIASARAILARANFTQFLRAEQTIQQLLAMTIQQLFHPPDAQDIVANAVHRTGRSRGCLSAHAGHR